MILRVLVLLSGFAGGLVGSQFPEFSQQYLQRLGGAVDALEDVVADFDASAEAVGLDRGAALEQMRGTPFMERRRIDMTRTFARYDALSRDLAMLQNEGPFMRAYRLPHMTDSDIARAAWAVYRPAVPLTFAGMTFTATGAALAAVLGWALLRMLLWPFGRSRGAAGRV